jgi:hypothetical protein
MSEVSSTSGPAVRRWVTASAISGLGAVAVALGGNWLYDRDPSFSGTRTALFMGVTLVLALVVFSYSVIPLLVRALIEVQAKLTSPDRPLVHRMREREPTIRLVAWAFWTLVVLTTMLGILRDGSHR